MASITTGLTQLMQTYYDKRFLDRAKAMLVYDWGAQKRAVPRNNGKVVYFNRFTPLAVATTALTEATNPAGSDMTSTIVSATVAEYGDYVKVGSLFDLTSIDVGLQEHTDVMGQQGGETVDTLIVKELSGGATAQLAGGKSALTDVAITDVMSGSEIRKARRTLIANKAMPFEDGFFRGIVGPYSEYDLFGNSEWQYAAGLYGNSQDQLKSAVVGKLWGVQFKLSNNSTEEVNGGASNADIQHNFIFGKNAYGIVDIGTSATPKMIVKQSGPQDTSNPLNMFSTIGWRVDAFACKTLNANWLINIKAGATSKT